MTRILAINIVLTKWKSIVKLKHKVQHQKNVNLTGYEQVVRIKLSSEKGEDDPVKQVIFYKKPKESGTNANKLPETYAFGEIMKQKTSKLVVPQAFVEYELRVYDKRSEEKRSEDKLNEDKGSEDKHETESESNASKFREVVMKALKEWKFDK